MVTTGRASVTSASLPPGAGGRRDREPGGTRRNTRKESVAGSLAWAGPNLNVVESVPGQGKRRLRDLQPLSRDCKRQWCRAPAAGGRGARGLGVGGGDHHCSLTGGRRSARRPVTAQLQDAAARALGHDQVADGGVILHYPEAGGPGEGHPACSRACQSAGRAGNAPVPGRTSAPPAAESASWQARIRIDAGPGRSPGGQSSTPPLARARSPAAGTGTVAGHQTGPPSRARAGQRVAHHGRAPAQPAPIGASEDRADLAPTGRRVPCHDTVLTHRPACAIRAPWSRRDAQMPQISRENSSG